MPTVPVDTKTPELPILNATMPPVEETLIKQVPLIPTEPEIDAILKEFVNATTASVNKTLNLHEVHPKTKNHSFAFWTIFLLLAAAFTYYFWNVRGRKTQFTNADLDAPFMRI